MFHAKFKVLARPWQPCQNVFLSVYLLKENHAGKYDLGLLTLTCSHAVENVKNLENSKIFSPEQASSKT